MSIRISVVVPSYNHARYVDAAVRSALSQDVDGLEVVVVDDGSRDDSLAVLGGIRDPRVRVIAQENQGTHAAYARGIGEARGEFLALLNSDDRYAPGRLRRALDALERDRELCLWGSYVQVIDAEGGPVAVKHGYLDLDPWPLAAPGRSFKADGDLRTALLLQNYWATTSNYVMPRSSWERFGPFRALRYAHDWDFALRLQREAEARLEPDALLEYRIHGSNTIRDDRAAMIYEVCWVLAVHVPRYLSDARFWEAGRARRADQLLHSIHVYGCERVFWGLWAQIHGGPPGSEEALLQKDDGARLLYVDEIRRVLASEAGSAALEEPLSFGRLRSLLRRVVGSR